MRSGWFWQTPMWQEYLQEYAKTRPECLHEWKSSPLANDHDFSEYVDEPASLWVRDEHQSQVIDLRTHKWSDVRKSYRGLINKATDLYGIHRGFKIRPYREAHILANGQVRTARTFDIQEEWLRKEYACTAWAEMNSKIVAAALWIIWQGKAYYASGPSISNNVQHAVVYHSLPFLKGIGVTLVDMGQIDGETEKERNIGKFKAGFGGEQKPFTIVRRTI